MTITPFTLTGEGVRLVPRTAEDLEAILGACQDPEIARWTTVPSPYTAADARWFVDHSVAAWGKDTPSWSIHRVGDDTFLGVIDLMASGPRTWELGYWTSPAHRGCGHMSEAVALATQAAFTRLDAVRVQWSAMVGNWGSWKAVWRNGFRREGVRRDVLDAAGHLSDHWTAALVRGDRMAPQAPWDGPGAAPADAAPALDPSRPLALVRQFHRTYSMPDRLSTGEGPTLAYERLGMRMSLVSEEYAELVGAVLGAQARREVEEAFARAVGLDDDTRDIVETADALADLVYVIYGMAIESGMDLDAVLGEVQASNLSKLMPDGTVKLREDGKVLKGPDFFRPDVRRALGLPPRG